MLHFLEQYGGTQNGIQFINKLLQHAFTQSRLSIGNGSIALNFIDEGILTNCEHFLPDPIKIPSNERSSHRRCSLKTVCNF